ATLRIGSAPTEGTLINAALWTVSGDVLLATTAGNVGIGTTSPNAKLSVVGNASVSTNFFVTQNLSVDSSTLYVDSNNDRVGIGTATPGTTLQVQSGNLGVSQVTAPAYGIATLGPVAIGTTTVGVYKLYVSGSIFATGVVDTSDIRLKKNIEPMEKSLGKLLRLQGVNYDWRVDEFPEMSFVEDRQTGFIAQEFEKEFPLLVEEGPNGFKAIAYDRFTAVLLEGIKELKSEKDAEIKTLKETNEKMKLSLCSLGAKEWC
ncbi:MAG: tail fiber domain-containing protein, partial [Nanoarchaeota archaeon]|nr:tail fiber domain-containing protein [Nanoarchaeota archaeon]